MLLSVDMMRLDVSGALDLRRTRSRFDGNTGISSGLGSGNLRKSLLEIVGAAFGVRACEVLRVRVLKTLETAGGEC